MTNFIQKSLLAAYVTCLTCMASISPYEDLGRIVPAVSSIGSFSYSSIQLPPGYGPPNSTMTLLQSPGIRTYFCQIPSSIVTSNVCIAVVLNNRFGSRFCNHHHGQLMVSLVCAHLKTLYNTKWTTNVISLGTSGVSFVVTPTSSGICIKIVSPITMLPSTISCLIGMVNDIYSTGMSDTDFDNACTSISIGIYNSIFNNPLLSSIPSNTLLLSTCLCRPKWDCSHQWTDYHIGGEFGIPIGSMESYGYNKSIAMLGIPIDRERGRLCLALFRRERDLSIFISASDSSVLPQIPLYMKTISEQLQTSYVYAYSRLFYGFCMPKGTTYSYARTNGQQTVTGGIIYLGPVSPESLLASQMILKLVNDHIVTTGSYTGAVNISSIPFAGQSTVRMCSSTTSAASSAVTWEVFLGTLKARYANNANTADFSDPSFMSLISNTYYKFIPATVHAPTNGESSNVDGVLTLDLEGYVNWMQIFQGSFKALSTLLAYTTDAPSNKTALLQKAAAIITAQADGTLTSEINYNVS